MARNNISRNISRNISNNIRNGVRNNVRNGVRNNVRNGIKNNNTVKLISPKNKQLGRKIIIGIFITLLLVLVGLGGYLLYKKITYYKSSNVKTTTFIPYIHSAQNAKTIQGGSIPHNIEGNEYNYNMWIYISDYSYRNNSDKCILYRGSTPTETLDNCSNNLMGGRPNTILQEGNPSLWLLKNVNTLRLVVGLETKYKNNNKFNDSHWPHNNIEYFNNIEKRESILGNTYDNFYKKWISIGNKLIQKIENFYSQNEAANLKMMPILQQQLKALCGKILTKPQLEPKFFEYLNNYCTKIEEAQEIQNNEDYKKLILRMIEEIKSQWISAAPSVYKMLPVIEDDLLIFMQELGFKQITTSHNSFKSKNTLKIGTCDIENIPLQRWVNINISQYNSVLDICIDGKLEKSCIMPGAPLMTQDSNLFVCKDGGYNGYIANLKITNKALSVDKIYNIYSEGPTIQN